MGLEDISLMRGIPNMKVIQPSTPIEAMHATRYLAEQKLDSPAYLRLGRQPVEEVFDENYNFEFGKGVTIQSGTDITLISTGCILPEVIKASKEIEAKGISCRIINIHTIKPIDREIIVKAAKETKKIFTIEDHSIIGGLGSAVTEVVSETFPTFVTRIGLKDIFPESAPPADLWHKYGLSASKIAEKVLNDL